MRNLLCLPSQRDRFLQARSVSVGPASSRPTAGRLEAGPTLTLRACMLILLAGVMSVSSVRGSSRRPHPAQAGPRVRWCRRPAAGGLGGPGQGRTHRGRGSSRGRQGSSRCTGDRTARRHAAAGTDRSPFAPVAAPLQRNVVGRPGAQGVVCGAAFVGPPTTPATCCWPVSPPPATWAPRARPRRTSASSRASRRASLWGRAS